MEIGDIKDISDPNLIEAFLRQLKAQKAKLKAIKPNKVEKAKEAAVKLSAFTDGIYAAQKAYEDLGFAVELETSSETGLITKWKLKNKYPKRIVVGGGVGNSRVQNDKTMSVQEFNSIVNLLGDGELSSKDIQDALTKGGIGARKLQPTLGLILKGMYGEPLIEKANEDTRGPGVRYRKVK